MSKAQYYNATALRDTMLAIAAMPEETVSAAEAMVLLVIAMHTGERTSLSYPTIAREAHMSRRTATRAVETLREKGYINVPGRHSSRANLYKLTLPSVSIWHGVNLTPCQDDTSRSANLSSDGVNLTLLEVPNLQIDSVNLAPEVLQESEPKAEPESVPSISTGDGPTDDASAPLSSPVQQDTKNTPLVMPAPAVKAEQPVVQEEQAAPAPPTDAAPSPDRTLVRLLFHKLGKPDKWRNNRQEWFKLFRHLLTKHTEDDLRGVIEWAFETSTFWPDKLMKARGGDPVAYFVEKLDTFMPDYRGQRKAQENAAKAAAAPTAAPSATSKRNDDLANHPALLAFMAKVKEEQCQTR